MLDEGVLSAPAELVLGDARVPIDCQITVEWPRGIPEPTWYGYFMPRDELRMLPGAYQLHISGSDHRILLRRPPANAPQPAVPFWGLGPPPRVPRASGA